MRTNFRKVLRRWLKPAWLYFLLPRLSPLSAKYGANRGHIIDRHYIEKFLADNAGAIQGVCLEVLDDSYTRRFGGLRVTRRDVLDINTSNRAANIHGDLRDLSGVADNTYDCIILTQVLQFVDDYEAAVRECARILKPGGTLLVSLPSISRIDVRAGLGGDYWRFTTASAKYVFGKYFSPDKLEITSRGNVRSGLGFWVGMAQEELTPKELNYRDPNFPVIITVRATR